MAFTIIPAIDLINGKCVRLSQGDYERVTAYDNDPVETAIRFAEAGITRLHLVDLEGARERAFRHWETLEAIVNATGMQVDASGGIQHENDVRRLLDCGARWVGVGSIAAHQPDTFMSWIGQFGADVFLLGADVRNGKVMTNGWMSDSGMEIMEYLHHYAGQGIKNVFVTDISRDGMMQGPALPLYRRIMESIPSIQLLASGGVSNVSDLADVRAAGCAGAIVGKAIYEGAISLEEIRKVQYAG